MADHKMRLGFSPTAFAMVALLVLAGCNTASFSDGVGATGTTRQSLRPTAPLGGQTALAPEQETGSQAQAALQRNADPLAARVPPVAFLPVTGAPQSTVTTLAGSMRRAAQEQAVPVVVSIRDGARYQLKGYFSALDDQGGTTLVYVWDVLDANGSRIHRISGQERGGASRGDPWIGISEEVIDRVARSTMLSLRNWLQSRGAG